MCSCQTGARRLGDESKRALVLNAIDDVAVALDPLAAGDRVDAGAISVVAGTDVPVGHKIALRSIAPGEGVRKYGEVIGFATRPIAEGEWVHSHNLEAGSVSRSVSTTSAEARAVGSAPDPGFLGYRRADGRVGTRNAVAIISTVNCSADPALILAARARAEMLPAYPSVDDVFAVTHKGGCGLPMDGDNFAVLSRCLRGMASHPNVSAVLVVGLGCEVMDPELIASAADEAGAPWSILTVQDCGGVGATVRRGLDVLPSLLARVSARRRSACTLSDLVVGTNCGGSDAYFCITANPLLGMVGDRVMAAGGRWALAESPETCGAEHLLIRRAASPDVGRRLEAVMERWAHYTASHGASVDNNPAPGNKAGGITTIYEKALGAVTKGGTGPLVEVLEYAARVERPGLTFMDTPGMDDVSVTGLVAGGCNLIAFTTGRGSCLAFKPTPVVKIATTSDLYGRMRDDMDFDAGVLMSGAPIEKTVHTLLQKILATASGERTAGEAQGLGEHTFAPWELGPTL
ncbi:MAG: altronate dehydratase [Armatimonadetes bacterium]|nr:altronate dehydratase [Armatimonadota bacterium]